MVSNGGRPWQQQSDFYAIMTCTDLILKTLIFPIWVIGIVLLYFDLRIRKEGFDIEIQVNSPDAMSIQVE